MRNLFKNGQIMFYKIMIFVFILMSSFVDSNFAQQASSKEDSVRIQRFYDIYHESLFWMSSGKNMRKANEWLTAIESADHSGYVSDKGVIRQLQTLLTDGKKIDPEIREKVDRQITGLILNYIKYLQQGDVRFEYDEVSVPHDSVYVSQLMSSKYKGSVSKIVSQLECKDPDYLVLKKYLNDSIADPNSLKYKTVLQAMNYRKYLVINHHSEYILVNIPAAEAEYFRNDLPEMKMRTVVGKKSKPTPTISSYVTSIVTFPPWNVPHDIAVKELLPKVQKDENYLEQNNFDIVDAKGNVVDDSELNWKEYTIRNFPYFFRQSAGADNSLGVLKFNLHNPFSIFLHATSWQGAFARDFRFLSHGCVRLENPFELADALLRGKLDIKELKSRKKNTQSNTMKLPDKVPVFIIYSPAVVVDNKVIFLKDVYGLIK